MITLPALNPEDLVTLPVVVVATGGFSYHGVLVAADAEKLVIGALKDGAWTHHEIARARVLSCKPVLFPKDTQRR